MGSPREPWIKLKIGFRRSGKIAGLPTDSARLGWLYVLLEAKTQRRMGVFDSRAHFKEVLGRFGRFFDVYQAARLLHIAPDLCTECQRRNGSDVKRGDVVVHDYLREQRDPTVADRVAAHRERVADDDGEPDAAGDVTPEKRPGNGQRNGQVTDDSRARGTTATETGTTTERRGSPSSGTENESTEYESVPAPKGSARANGTGPTLSRAEFDAWRSFGPEWDMFKAAWLDRGFRLPPRGAPDDESGQRGLLWPILDARPTTLPQWIREAKGQTPYEVVAYVLQRWHAIRAEAGVDERGWQATKASDRGSAAASIGSILNQVRDREPAGKA